MKILILIIFSSLLVAACTFSKAKENINKVGNATGEVVGELATGVAKGVENTLEPKIEQSQSVKDKGISFGKISVKNDIEGTDNLLIVYMIFSKKTNDTMLAKVFDGKGLEMGRAKVQVKGEKDDAQFIEFHFDKRTNIDNDSKITIE